MQCHAKSKRSQEQCKRHVTPGMTVCRFHGGKTPIGPGLPQFKDGHRSKFLPSRMASAFHASMRDPTLMDLRRDIATVDARIIDVLKRVDTGEAGVIWREAQATVNAFEMAQARGRIDELRILLERLKALISRGAGDYGAWHEVGDLIERRRKLIDSEQRRLAIAHEVLTIDRAMIFVARIVDAITQHVSDRKILGSIVGELQTLQLMDDH